MQTTTIIARDSRTALDEVTRQLGPDALVFETRRHPRGVEIVAAIEGYVPPRSPKLAEPDAFVRFAEQAADIGFDRTLLSRLDRHGIADPTEAWTRFLALLDREVAIAPPPHLAGQHLCVIGGSGTGKTTVLAQIAARIRRDDPAAPIAFLSADTRHGAREQLRLIATDLAVPFLDLDHIGEAGGGRLLVDMPSDPYTARQLAETLRMLPGGVTMLCTLPLTAQRARHRQMLQHFQGLTDALVITHAGEALPPGALIAALVEAKLPLAYLSRDADPAGAIEPARSSALYRLIVAALSGASPALQ